MKNMMVRNIMHKALCMAATLLFASTASFADNIVINWEGNGSADNPYLIKTAKDLAGIAYYTEKGVSFGNVFFKLAKDIDLSDYDNWTPIGTQEHPFMGVLDGKDPNEDKIHTIDYLTINAAEKNKVGLFGYVDKATIKNLTIGGNSSVIGNFDVAAVVGAAYNCIISNVHNEADVTGKYATIGGILGQAYGNAILTNCTNSGAIKSLWAEKSFTHVGGIAGFCQNGNIINCTNNGPVTSDKGEFTGGIIGCGAGNPGAVSMKIIGCTNNGSVTSASSAVGGIAGAIGYGPDDALQITVSMCTNKGTVKSTAGEYMGGIVGAVNHYRTEVQNCKNEGKILSENTVTSIGGIIGNSNYGYISDCVNNESVTATGPSSMCESVGGIVGRINGMELYNSSVKNCLNNGDVTTEGPYTGGIVGLYAGGQTDAQPHYIHVKLVENCTNKGNITNTESANGSSNVGGIVGHGPAIVNKCKNEASVTGSQSHVGGIVGTCGTIINCYNTGNVTCNSSGTTYDDAGGLLGFNWTEIYGQDLFVANSYSRGDIKTAGNSNFVGTVAASGYTAIYNCYGSGKVQYSGGESRYVVGACYHDGEPRIFSAHTYNKYGVFGGPTEYKSQVLFNENANAHEIENYIIKNVEPYSSYHSQTVLSFLQERQGSSYQQFSIGDPSSPVIKIETVAWKKGADDYPAFVTDPGYVEPVVPTYSVSYSLNATGSASDISAPPQQSSSQSYTVCDIVSEGIYSYVSGNVKYSFIGWNTKSDGTGDSYVAGSKITPLENTTLYGMWAEGFQIRYALADGLSADDFVSLTLPFDSEWHDSGSEVTVKMPASTDFSPTTFDFWSTVSDGSGDRFGTAYESKFTITGDMVIYANVHDITKQKIVIERTDLKAGENAVYTVTGPEPVKYVVVLEGKEESNVPVKVSTTIANVPETGLYTVTETGWNWTYKKSEPSVDAPDILKGDVGEGWATATMDDNRTLTFTFGGEAKEEEMPKHGENAKKN